MIDVKSGLLVWSVETITLATILLVAGLHKRSSTMVLWSVGVAMHGAGIGLVACRGQIPDFLSIEIANAVALSAYAFAAAGLRVKDGRRLPLACLLPTAVWIAGMGIPVIRETLSYRACVFSLGSAIGSLQVAHYLWQTDFGTRQTRRKLVGVFVCEAIVHFVSIVILIRSPAATLQDMASFPVAALTAATLLILLLILTFRMIMEESEKHLKNLVRLDSLTGALNRRGFFERFETIRHEAEQSGKLVALVLFDLDHFKQINDRHGHAAGDQTLRVFSQIAAKRLGAHGAFGRLGGEEFAAILQVEDRTVARAIADGIRRELAGKSIVISAQTGERAIGATVSAGICVRAAKAADADGMLSAADKSLYAAKRAGRNRLDVDSAGLGAEDEPALSINLPRTTLHPDESDLSSLAKIG